MKILLIEDDIVTADSVKAGLLPIGWTVDHAADGAEGSFMARSYEYDVILLDYSLPKKDGLAVCKEIRSAGKTSPIIFLSITGSTDTKVLALEHGADDYMTKPYSLAELMARIRAVTRRPSGIQEPIIRVGDLELDSKTSTASRNGRVLRLTKKELSLLEFLMKNAGTVVSRPLIMERVWSAESDPFSNTVEAHIRNLRKKLNEGGLPDPIRNIQGRGYVIDKI